MTLLQLVCLFVAAMAMLPLAALLDVHRKIVPVRYVDSLPNNLRGRANGFRIEIKKDIPYQQSTYFHEMEHIRQSWLLCIIGHRLLDRFSKRYAVWHEAKAYAVSVKHGRPLNDAAFALSMHGPSLTQAKQMIEKYL